MDLNDLNAISEKADALEASAKDITEKLDQLTSEDSEAQEALQNDLKAVKEQLEVLEGERNEAIAEAEKKAMQDEIETLKSRFEAARKSPEGFGFNTGNPGAESEEEKIYGPEGQRSFFVDVKAAHGGDSRAWERLEKVTQSLDGKAMKEGTDAAGGFLVPPEISNELLTLRAASGVLRGLIPTHQITVDEFRVRGIESGLSVAWVAEEAEKPASDLGFGEQAVSVFTAAGLAVVSNQLLRDNKFGLDRIIVADFAKRFVALEEQAILNGNGTGKPKGIYQTPGVDTVEVTEAKASKILDAVVSAITNVYSNYFGAPNAIVMHPRTWAFLVKAREEGTPSSYVLGPGSTTYGRNATDPLPGYGQGATPRGEIFGIPVYTTSNVPTTLGEGEESAIFVGNWSEGLILDREGITTDLSEHVFFTTNQTVFRSEERMGFTAARYPEAFSVVHGKGLKGI